MDWKGIGVDAAVSRPAPSGGGERETLAADEGQSSSIFRVTERNMGGGQSTIITSIWRWADCAHREGESERHRRMIMVRKGPMTGVCLGGLALLDASSRGKVSKSGGKKAAVGMIIMGQWVRHRYCRRDACLLFHPGCPCQVLHQSLDPSQERVRSAWCALCLPPDVSGLFTYPRRLLRVDPPTPVTP